IATPARRAVWCGVVAARREPVVDAERASGRDDFLLRELDQRSVDLETSPSFDTRFGREIGQRLKGGDVLGAAIGIAAIVQRVDPDEDAVRAQALGPRPPERGKK